MRLSAFALTVPQDAFATGSRTVFRAWKTSGQSTPKWTPNLTRRADMSLQLGSHHVAPKATLPPAKAYCAASSVLSQTSEGWTALPDIFDDGEPSSGYWWR